MYLNCSVSDNYIPNKGRKDDKHEEKSAIPTTVSSGIAGYVADGTAVNLGYHSGRTDQWSEEDRDAGPDHR